MRYLRFLFLLTFANSAAAQQLRIDSMFVHEQQNQLLLFGSFDTAKGTVSLDFEQLTIAHWNDTSILCNLPKDSIWAGPVTIESSGNRSATRMLTGYVLDATYYDQETDSTQFTQHGNMGNIHWIFPFRLDLDVALHDSATRFQIIPRLSSGYTSFSGGGKFEEGGTTYQNSEEGQTVIPPDLGTASIIFLGHKKTLLVNTQAYPVIDVAWTNYTTPGPPVTTNGSFTSGPPALTMVYALDSAYVFKIASWQAGDLFYDAFMGPPTSSQKQMEASIDTPRFPPPFDTTKSGVAVSVKDNLTLSLSPNPVSTRATLSFTLPDAEFANIELVDICGRVVKNVSSGMLLRGKQLVAIDATGLPSGVYLCRAMVGSAFRTVSMIKVR